MMDTLVKAAHAAGYAMAPEADVFDLPDEEARRTPVRSAEIYGEPARKPRHDKAHDTGWVMSLREWLPGAHKATA